MPIIEHILDQGLSFCVFDFHGNGMSTGKYVTFGWTETLDLDAIITELILKFNVSSVMLWGRSMGAVTSILYLSQNFREEVYRYFKQRHNLTNLGFID